MVVASLLALAACSGVETPETSETPDPGSGEEATGPAPSESDGALPDLVGKGLQFSQDAAQAAGYHNLTSHDSSGRERLQVSDRSWKVCFQTPAPGPADPDTQVDFGVVKLEESCPSVDATSGAPASTAPAVMPELIGKSARAAEQALGSNASLTFRDATGRERNVFITSNWQVCDQQPAAGRPYAGVPVTLDVVKYGESC